MKGMDLYVLLANYLLGMVVRRIQTSMSGKHRQAKLFSESPFTLRDIQVSSNRLRTLTDPSAEMHPLRRHLQLQHRRRRRRAPSPRRRRLHAANAAAAYGSYAAFGAAKGLAIA